MSVGRIEEGLKPQDQAGVATPPKDDPILRKKLEDALESKDYGRISDMINAVSLQQKVGMFSNPLFIHLIKEINDDSDILNHAIKVAKENKLLEMMITNLSQTALIAAVFTGSFAKVSKLIDAGADLQAKSKQFSNEEKATYNILASAATQPIGQGIMKDLIAKIFSQEGMGPKVLLQLLKERTNSGSVMDILRSLESINKTASQAINDITTFLNSHYSEDQLDKILPRKIKGDVDENTIFGPEEDFSKFDPTKNEYKCNEPKVILENLRECTLTLDKGAHITLSGEEIGPGVLIKILDKVDTSLTIIGKIKCIKIEGPEGYQVKILGGYSGLLLNGVTAVDGLGITIDCRKKASRDTFDSIDSFTMTTDKTDDMPPEIFQAFGPNTTFGKGTSVQINQSAAGIMALVGMFGDEDKLPPSAAATVAAVKQAFMPQRKR